MTRSPAREMMAAGTLFADSFRYGLERYGSNRNRHWWGIAHRARLIGTDEYIKTSETPRYVFKWADPVPKSAESMREAINDMLIAMDLSTRLQTLVLGSDIRKLRDDS